MYRGIQNKKTQKNKLYNKKGKKGKKEKKEKLIKSNFNYGDDGLDYDNKNKIIYNKTISSINNSKTYKVTKKDYIKILNFYANKENKKLYNYKFSLENLKKETEKKIAEKLCSCIKKVDKRILDEAKAIGICNYSVIKRKKLGIHKFTCKKTPELKVKNNSRKNSDKLYKNTRDHI